MEQPLSGQDKAPVPSGRGKLDTPELQQEFELKVACRYS